MTCSVQSEVSIKKEQLLNEFVPDDVCPLGAQLFMDTPNQVDRVDSKDNFLVEVNSFHYFSFLLILGT